MLLCTGYTLYTLYTIASNASLYTVEGIHNRHGTHNPEDGVGARAVIVHVSAAHLPVTVALVHHRQQLQHSTTKLTIRSPMLQI